MKTYNTFIAENMFNKKTIRFTTSQIKNHSAQLHDKKKSKEMLEFVYNRFLNNDEDAVQQKYKTKTELELFNQITNYFKQNMFLGFINFEQTKKKIAGIMGI